MAAFYIVQAGTALEAVQTDGTRTALSLPTGITLVSTRFPRFATLGRNLVMVNSPTRSLWIDTDQTVRPMSIAPPAAAPTLLAGAAGTLSGVFKVRVTFGVKDVNTGEVLLESFFSPISAANTAISAKKLKANGIPVSPDSAVNFRRLYRTTDGGSVFFRWLDIDDNTQVSVEDDLADLSLNLVAAPTDLGSPPGTTAPTRMVLLVSWRGRLWGVGTEDLDTLLFSADSKFYAWPPGNGFIIPPKGKDARGITGLLPRQDELGVGRYDSLHTITGTTESNFTRVQIVEGIGVLSQESVQVIRDKAYFLGNPYGVYRWDASGVVNISEKQVNKWFTSGTYFNRSRFNVAFSGYDPVNHLYILFLANAGDTSENRWIYYDLQADEWYGPHKTGAFTPSCGVGVWNGGALADANDLTFPAIGGTTGFIWKNQDTRTDDTATAIDFDVDSAFHSADTPSIQKLFEQMDILTKVQSSGTLTVTPKYGGLDATAGTAMTHDMTLGRQRLAYGQAGRLAQFNFRNNNTGEDVVVYGYEVPTHELGRM